MRFDKEGDPIFRNLKEAWNYKDKVIDNQTTAEFLKNVPFDVNDMSCSERVKGLLKCSVYLKDKKHELLRFVYNARVFGKSYIHIAQYLKTSVKCVKDVERKALEVIADAMVNTSLYEKLGGMVGIRGGNLN